MVEFRSKLDSSTSHELNNNRFKKILWLYFFFMVLFISFGAILILTKKNNSDFRAGVGLIVFGVVIGLLCLGYWLTLFSRKGIVKSAKYISNNTEEVYTFDEEYITITQTQSDVFMSTLKAKYSFIYKASENNNYFYIYISKIQNYIIDKSSITQGTLEEVTMLLKTNLGDKFKSK